LAINEHTYQMTQFANKFGVAINFKLQVYKYWKNY